MQVKSENETKCIIVHIIFKALVTGTVVRVIENFRSIIQRDNIVVGQSDQKKSISRSYWSVHSSSVEVSFLLILFECTVSLHKISSLHKETEKKNEKNKIIQVQRVLHLITS